jgi:hypothetical protein
VFVTQATIFYIVDAIRIAKKYCGHWEFLTSNDFSAERFPSIDVVADNFRRGLQSHKEAGAKNQLSCFIELKYLK